MTPLSWTWITAGREAPPRPASPPPSVLAKAPSQSCKFSFFLCLFSFRVHHAFFYTFKRKIAQWKRIGKLRICHLDTSRDLFHPLLHTSFQAVAYMQPICFCLVSASASNLLSLSSPFVFLSWKQEKKIPIWKPNVRLKVPTDLIFNF